MTVTSYYVMVTSHHICNDRSVFLKLINKKLKPKNLLLQFVLGPVKGMLDLLDYLEPVAVVLWWHVPRSNRWTTWMTELLDLVVA